MSDVTLDAVVDLARARRMLRTGEAKQVRLAAGVSLGEVARVLGMPISTVSRWENCSRVPRASHGRALRYLELIDELASRPPVEPVERVTETVMVDGLDNVRQITENMREFGTGRLATLATRHAPFVLASHSRRVHHVKFVRVDWRTKDTASLYVGYLCGEGTGHPTLLLERPDLALFSDCQKCEARS